MSSFAVRSSVLGAVHEVDNSIFGGIGLVGKRKLKHTDSNIRSYQEKLVKEDKVSNKEEPYLAPEIQSKLDKMKDLFDRGQVRIRAYDGFYIACHVFAYLSGKEKWYGNNWLESHRRAANMICRGLGLSQIYPGLDKYILEDSKDYAIDAPGGKPIITKEVINEAFRRFPVEFSVKDSFEDGDSKPIKVLHIEEDPVVVEHPEDDIPEGTIDPEEADIISVVVEPKEEKIKPIFDFAKMDLVSEDMKSVTETQKRKFEEAFGEFVKDKSYQLNRFPGGAIQLVFNNGDGTFPTYWIDPDVAVGNGYMVLGNYVTGNPVMPLDTIPVHSSEKEILKKVLENPTYVLTPEEIQRCMSHMFTNQKIYSIVDMSNMSNRLSKLSEDEFRKLGQKFTYIINSLSQNEMGRLRVNSWKSIDKFTMISDEKCKSPFPGTTLVNYSGVEVSVDKDTVTIKFQGIPRVEKIENYGII